MSWSYTQILYLWKKTRRRYYHGSGRVFLGVPQPFAREWLRASHKFSKTEDVVVIMQYANSSVDLIRRNHKRYASSWERFGTLRGWCPRSACSSRLWRDTSMRAVESWARSAHVRPHCRASRATLDDDPEIRFNWDLWEINYAEDTRVPSWIDLQTKFLGRGLLWKVLLCCCRLS